MTERFLDSGQEKENYHHGDLRQAILEAACRQLLVESADSLSLRALAREIGVSQTAPYRHFDSRNALFAAIATWGFEILEAKLRDILNADLSATECMIETGLAYLQFAGEHAEKYQMFYDSSLVDFSEYVALQTAGANCFEVMLEQIRRGQAEGVVRDQPEEELAALIWSGLHGIASLVTMHQGYKEDEGPVLPVVKAVNYLADNRREAISRLLSSVLVT